MRSLWKVMDKNMNSFDKLMFLNKELFKMVENSISLDLLARLYSSQLVTRGDRHLLDHNRTYFKVTPDCCGGAIQRTDNRKGFGK